MGYARNKVVQLPTPSTEGPVIATIASIDEQGVAFVEYAGSPTPIAARSAVSAPVTDPMESYVGQKVLLTFENGEPTSPVIVGFVRNTLFPESHTETVLDVSTPKEVVLDGEKLCLNAKEEITLRCGRSAIILKKNGRVVVKGVEITNRALRSNKIKGGTVRIN